MHSCLQNVINRFVKKNQGDIQGFDEDPLAKSINLAKHCYGEFSMANVQANDTMEDHSQVEVASRNALFLGVYDGHGGVQASAFTSEFLFRNLIRIAADTGNIITQDTLRDAVSLTENQFMNYVRKYRKGAVDLGTPGTCCLAGFIWRKTLYIANLGDSRAIIVSMVEGTPVVEQLTRDHNCRDIGIREEVRRLHPNDPQIVMKKKGSWRVKGVIEVSRTIGDAYLKRPGFTFRDSFPKNPPGYELPNSCVLSAEPEMHTRHLRKCDKFLIFASDGLWDLLSNDQVAQIVSSNPRNGIAKRLLSVALTEAATRMGLTYKHIQASPTGRNTGSRRPIHDDISVIVVFLDRTSFMRKSPIDMSYRGAEVSCLVSGFTNSKLTDRFPDQYSAQALKEKFKKLLKSKSSSNLGESSESRPSAKSRWNSLKKLFFPNRR